MSCKSSIASQKRVLVTGGNRGIGEALTILMVETGFEVVCTTRNPAFIEKIKTKISAAKRDLLSCVCLHLDTIQSVEESLPAIVALHQERPFDIVVLNAGVMFPAAISGTVEPTFHVNYLGHYMLAHELVKTRLNLEHPMHFVGVGSILMTCCTWPFMPFPRTISEMAKAYGPRSDAPSGWASYAFSKGCLTQLVLDLGELPNVTSAAVDPGNCRTEISRNMPLWQARVLGCLLRHTLIPVSLAAYRIFEGVLSPIIDQQSFYRNSKMAQLPQYIVDRQARQNLVEFSEKLISENKLYH